MSGGDIARTAEIEWVRLADQAAIDTADADHANLGFLDDGTLAFVDELGVTHVLAESTSVHAALTIGTDVDAVFGLSAQYLTLDTQTANYLWAGPTSGAAAKPTFRPLAPLDLATSGDDGDILTVAGGMMTWAAGGAVHAAVTLGADAGAVLGLTGQQIDLDTQAANTVFAGPTSGAAADPTFRALVRADLPTDYETMNLLIDGGGSAITTGVKADIDFEDDFTIEAWRILPDQSGYLTVDLWVDTWANYPPTDADSITNGHEPALDGEAKAEDTDLSDWGDTTIAAGQTLRVNVDSASTVTRATLALKLLRT